MLRARTAEDKEFRRRSILEAMLAALQERPFAQVAMADVAVVAGVSKGTLYLYYRTKEELALALLEELLSKWLDAVDQVIDGVQNVTPRKLASVMADELERNAPLARLLAVLQTVLEHNIDVERARRFKTWLLGRLTATGARLERHFPGLKPGGGARLLLWVNALVVGIGQMADPAPVVRRVLAEPELAPLAVDFRREFIEALDRLLAGVAKGRKP